MTIKINGDNTVANPGFSGDDTDTGLQVGTNELKLVTGGSEAVTVNSSQNVGIGTSSPGGKLEVKKDGTGNALQLWKSDLGTNNNRSVAFYSPDIDSGSEPFYWNTGNSFAWNTDGQERVRINSSGSVGIGTNSPAVELDVNGEVRASTGVLFGTDTAADNTLDDYEEGAWTPTFSGDTTAGAYTFTHEAWYVKIGRLVTVYAMLLNITDTTVGSGHVVIGGLPFTSNSSKDSVGSVRLDKFDLDSSTRGVSATVYANTSVIKLLETRDNTTDINITVTKRTTDGSDIFVQITYFTA